MEARVVWREGIHFIGECEGNVVSLDAKPPLGAGSGFTPKELMAIAAAGCTAMDVAALLKKYVQPLEALVVTAVPTVAKDHPLVFTEITLTFHMTGQLDPQRAIEAVRLSQTKYCVVSAMLSPSVPIHYQIILNGKDLAKGEAHFEKPHIKEGI
ncbi:MAG: OsmC family protein [Parachlamydiales bacterium]